MDNARLSEAAREAALNRLMSTYGTNVLRVCFLYLHDHALAQDAAQTTFLRAWQALDTLRSSETEKAWLMQIAVNTCRSILRSREYRHYAHGADPEKLPEPFTETPLRDPTVYHAVRALPDKYREVIVLYYYQSLTAPEVAAILHIPQASVRTRLHRARKLLEPLLKGWYLNDE